MQTWDYDVFGPAGYTPGTQGWVQALSERGAQGWEAVGVVPVEQEGRPGILLKRPVQKEANPEYLGND